jgi:hypothetical protein
MAIYLTLGLHKGRPSYRRSLHPSKENIWQVKKLEFSSLLRVIMALLDPDSYSQCGSGSGSSRPK